MSDSDDFFEFLEDLEETSNSRPRLLRQIPEYLTNFDDVDFFNKYRMSKQAALFVLNKIEVNVEFSSKRNHGASAIKQLLIALRFYATGGHLISVGDVHGVQESTVSRIVKRVSAAIAQLRPEFIKFPQNDIDSCKEDFYNIANFPSVIGAVDCTHVQIKSPGGQDAELFRNKKGYFSINVQTVADADTKVCNVVAGWPGSTHDSAIFTNSQIHNDFERGCFGDSCLLGDIGYPLKKYLLTPYLHPQTEEQEKYNAIHEQTRSVVELQHDFIKRRFPALALGLRIKVETAIDVIISCCILHNICIDFKEEMPPNEVPNIDQVINNGKINYEHIQTSTDCDDTRLLITRHFFSEI